MVLPGTEPAAIGYGPPCSLGCCWAYLQDQRQSPGYSDLRHVKIRIRINPGSQMWFDLLPITTRSCFRSMSVVTLIFISRLNALGRLGFMWSIYGISAAPPRSIQGLELTLKRRRKQVSKLFRNFFGHSSHCIDLRFLLSGHHGRRCARSCSRDVLMRLWPKTEFPASRDKLE